jgi:hypothetical protein
MDDLVAQGFWHQKHSTIDGRSLRGRRHRFHVANVADGFKDLLPRHRIRRSRQQRVAGRHLGAADELREVVDIGQSQCIRAIFGIGGDLANGTRVHHPQPARHIHLIHVGIRSKGKQAPVLVLPAKRPTRVWPGASNIGTWMASPRIKPWLWSGWLLAIASSVESSTASTKPSPSVFNTARKLRTFSDSGKCSRA